VIDASSSKVFPRDVLPKPTGLSQTLLESPAKKRKLDKANPKDPTKAFPKKRTKSVTCIAPKSNQKVINEIRSELMSIGAAEAKKKTHKKTSSGIRVSHSRERNSCIEWLTVPKPLPHRKTLNPHPQKNRRSEATSKRSMKFDQNQLHDTSNTSQKYSLPRGFLVVAKNALSRNADHPQPHAHEQKPTPTKPQCEFNNTQQEPDFEKSHLIIRDAQVDSLDPASPKA
jgi:hypothetical protein